MDLSSRVQAMTLEEKASLCSGLNNADTKPIERLNLPPVKMHDGPNGLRREDESVTDSNFGGYTSVPAVCYPGGCALACSWDASLMDRLGRLLAAECHAERLPILLGPAINIKRSPLCGRNFEYLSEDPYLAGKLAAAYIRGVQSQGIGTGLKHFAVNNQERRRQTVNAVVDERALREIYLTAFEIAVKEGDPWTVMCAYNRLNGVYCCENEWLLQKVLRDEWGFSGFVMSDWGAVNDRVASLKAGLELEMPYSGSENDRQIADAARRGTLPMETLDRAVARMLPIIDKGAESLKDTTPYDQSAHHLAARELAAECAVLLKNEGGLLPLAQEGSLAVLGGFAQTARYQGGGAAHVLTRHVDSPLEEIRRFAPQAQWAEGYPADVEQTDGALLSEAIALAKACDRAVLFVGLTDDQESEAFDRPDMRMPAGHTALIEAVARVNPRVTVVLMAGSPVEMEWEDRVSAVLHMNLGGEATGGAAADLLFGHASPGGRLAESYPLRLEHNPSYLNFGEDRDETEYREGVYVGYRYYSTKRLPVRHPFGFGLSYTSFAYENLRLSAESIDEREPLTVTATVRNTGRRAGSEVVQLYVRPLDSRTLRPDRELKGFAKLRLAPGEARETALTLDRRAFAWYDARLGDWRVDSGRYELLIGASCEDVRLSATVEVRARDVLEPVTENTTVGDLCRDPRRKALLEEMMTAWAPKVYKHYAAPEERTECSSLKMIREMYQNLTLRGIRLSAEGTLTARRLQEYIDRMNDAGKDQA